MPVAETRDAAVVADKATCNTIYLLKAPKFILPEVNESEAVLVETPVLACDATRFHLHMQTLRGEEIAAVAGLTELHVHSTHNCGRSA